MGKRGITRWREVDGFKIHLEVEQVTLGGRFSGD